MILALKTTLGFALGANLKSIISLKNKEFYFFHGGSLLEMLSLVWVLRTFRDSIWMLMCPFERYSGRDAFKKNYIKHKTKTFRRQQSKIYSMTYFNLYPQYECPLISNRKVHLWRSFCMYRQLILHSCVCGCL